MKTIILIFFLILLYELSYSKNTKIVIIYSNNTNGILENCECPSHPYGALEKRATVIDSIRKAEENVILVDAGDIFNIWNHSLLHKYIARAYKLLNYDVWAAGDQDFVEGSDFFFDNLVQQQMQLVNTNIFFDGNLIGKKYLLKNIKNLRIGFTGTLDHSLYKYFSENSKKSFIVEDKINSLEPVLKELSSVCDFIILISHSGIDKDEEIAKEFPEIDLIIGGHSQTLIKDPEQIGETLIVQAGEHGYRLGLLKLSFNKNKLQSFSNEIILLDLKISGNPEMKKLINDFYKEKANN